MPRVSKKLSASILNLVDPWPLHNWGSVLARQWCTTSRVLLDRIRQTSESRGLHRLAISTDIMSDRLGRGPTLGKTRRLQLTELKAWRKNYTINFRLWTHALESARFVLLEVGNYDDIIIGSRNGPNHASRRYDWSRLALVSTEVPCMLD